jgi:hypothetical protein
MKKQYLAIAILAALIVIYLVVQKRETSMTAPESKTDVLDVDTSAVNKVVLKRLGGAITLSRAGGAWYLVEDQSYKADTASVRQLLETIAGLTVGNVISDNPGNQMTFQVDTLTGQTVELYTGDRLLSSFVVGKMATDFRHTYIRLSGKDEVYLAEGMLSRSLSKNPTNWRDKTIVDIPAANVQQVEFKFGNEHYRVIREDTLWFASKAPFDEKVESEREKAGKLVASLCTLKASEFAAARDSASYSFDSLSYNALITLTDGSSQVVEAGVTQGSSDKHYVRTSTPETTFILFNAPWQNIVKTYDELLATEKSN